MSKISQDFAKEIEVLQRNFGMAITEETYDPQNFGNGYLILTGLDITIRFVRDRGQIFLDLTKKAGDWLYADDLLNAILQGSCPQKRDVAENIALICTHFDEIVGILDRKQ